MQYEILEWDTKFFGVPVARILRPEISMDELLDVVEGLKSKGVTLIYWSTPAENSSPLITQLNGHLADIKTTFSLDLTAPNNAPYFSEVCIEANVMRFDLAMSKTEAESLAIQSGEYSRFALDKNIPRDRYENLYRTWIGRSLNKEIAEEVLVVRDAGKLVGLITLGRKQARGDIGLLAVDKYSRGKGVGKALVSAANSWFIDKKFKSAQVVTQGSNIPALRLYQKCGYVIEKTEYIYHFWPLLQANPNTKYLI